MSIKIIIYSLISFISFLLLNKMIVHIRNKGVSDLINNIPQLPALDKCDAVFRKQADLNAYPWANGRS